MTLNGEQEWMTPLSVVEVVAPGCRVCYFGAEFRPGWFHCRRHPPHCDAIDELRNGRYRVVLGSDWCGEFHRMGFDPVFHHKGLKCADFTGQGIPGVECRDLDDCWDLGTRAALGL